MSSGHSTGEAAEQRVSPRDLHHINKRPAKRGICNFYGGDEGIRTLDPGIANAVLSQLSYIPICQLYTLPVYQFPHDSHGYAALVFGVRASAPHSR